MVSARFAAIALLSAAMILATVADWRTLARRERGAGTVLEADFHVHAFPGDGSLPRWELQREAARRGLDVIAITNHNQVFAARFATFLSGADVIVLPGQEVTTPDFHLIAVGITNPIDWRLGAAAAIAAIHRQGGVAIAAHPVASSWLSRDDEALRDLDGVEAAHPIMYFFPDGRAQIEEFHARVRRINPDVAPIGSSDGHALPGIGDCRSFLFVEERSERGVLDAIRKGRTVASDGRGRYTGPPELVDLVQAHISASPSRGPAGRLQLYAATAVLFALAGLVVLK